MSTHDPSASIRFGLSGHPPHTHTHEPISDGRRIFVLPQLRICIRLTAKSAQCHHVCQDHVCQEDHING
ncbi:hypothetical protein CFRS1_v016030 [Colletotrichum fructicola]|nr:hypothetical protein CFRS1_v016030 [Colletotrichum fructicola]